MRGDIVQGAGRPPASMLHCSCTSRWQVSETRSRVQQRARPAQPGKYTQSQNVETWTGPYNEKGLRKKRSNSSTQQLILNFRSTNCRQGRFPEPHVTLTTHSILGRSRKLKTKNKQMGPNETLKLLQSKGNYKQDEKTTLRVGKSICKRINGQRINFQNI